MRHHLPGSKRRRAKTASLEHHTAIRRVLLDFLIALGICAAVLGFAGLDAGPIRAAESVAAPNVKAHKGPVVQPAQMNSGSLLLKTRTPGKFIEAPRLGTDVKVQVSGAIARTRISQRFFNPSKAFVEAVYVFPLPERSAADTLRLQVGKRFLEGRIQTKAHARRIYERAKSDGYRTALIEQQRPNIFTNEVANIGPGETVVVQIEYQQALRFDDGQFSLRVPLVVAPRFLPKPDVNFVRLRAGPEEIRFSGTEKKLNSARISGPVLHPRRGKTNPVTLQVMLDTGFPIDDLKSHHHEMVVERLGAGLARLEFASRAAPADRDFELTWRVRPGAVPATALFTQKQSGTADDRVTGEFLYALINPPRMPADAAQLREVIFLLDTSASMSGEALRQARASLKKALQRLRPDDRFNFIHFNSDFAAFFDAPVPATADHVAKVSRFVDALEAGGGTRMLPALRAALADENVSGDAKTNRIRQIVFLTDGAVGNEAELFSELAANRGRSRLFTVGIGSAPNSFFMRRAAEIGRGFFTHIGEITQVEARMDGLFKKLERPAVTDLKLTWPAGVKAEAFPDPLPDIYAGEPISFAARTTGLKGELLLEGLINGRTWRQSVRLTDATPANGIAKLWARQKIAGLESRRYAGQDVTEISSAIEQVGLTYGLVTRRTSMVAVDVAPSRPKLTELERTEVPLNLPAGWDFDGLFGEKDIFPAPQKIRLDRAQKKLLKHLKTSIKAISDSTTRRAGAATESDLAKLRYARFSAGAVAAVGRLIPPGRPASRARSTALLSSSYGGHLAKNSVVPGVNTVTGILYDPMAAGRAARKPSASRHNSLPAPGARAATQSGKVQKSSQQPDRKGAKKTAQLTPPAAIVTPLAPAAGTAASANFWPTPGQQSLIGVLAIIFSGMFVITIWLWRSFRRELDSPRQSRRRS